MYKIDNPDTFRKNIGHKFNLFIEDEKIAMNLEKGVYNYAIKEATSKKIIKKWENVYFTQLYLDRLRSIYLNLKNNADLISQIKSHDITPQNLAFMTGLGTCAPVVPTRLTHVGRPTIGPKTIAARSRELLTGIDSR
jgi:hypothetical protein